MSAGTNRRMSPLIVVFVLVTTAPTFAGNIIHVDADATGINDGSSWADAFNNLPDPLDIARPGDEIHVAQGTYKPDQGDIQTSGDRNATFQLISGVTVKGGYAGFGEPDPDARDIELYETILSGDLNGDDRSDFSNKADNSLHVVTGSESDETAILDGCTIAGGYATDPYNSCGGGMYNYQGNPRLIRCTFSGNSAYGDGGGLYNQDSSPTLTYCTFNSNTVEWDGGGIYNHGGSPKLTNCKFSNNIASDGDGGGMYNNCSSPVLSDCIFTANEAYWDGGGMYNYDSSPILTSCMFLRNYGIGGGVCNAHSSPTLTNCSFTMNLGDERGGGMYNWGSVVTLTNCTFAGNSAIHGNAIACDSFKQQYPSNLETANCILWDGDNGIWNNDNSAINITYSDVQGSWKGKGNINADPCFVQPGYWDANGVWIDGDYHLLPDSPCIDAGYPDYVAGPNETDLDGNPRVIGGRIDMGAYEYGQLISAEARIAPRTINLASKGNWITCYIWLPDQYNVADIDPNSIFLENEIEPEQFSVNEQQQVATAKFIREDVQPILEVGDIKLKITGQLMDGTSFEATDIIKVTSQKPPK